LRQVPHHRSIPRAAASPLGNPGNVVDHRDRYRPPSHSAAG